jgi:hypothetical protein
MRRVMSLLLLLVLATVCGTRAWAADGVRAGNAGRWRTAEAADLTPPRTDVGQGRLQPMSLTPQDGVSGTVVSYAAGGLTPGQSLLLQWQTWDGSYNTTTSPETVQYNRRQFVEREVTLGSVGVASDGTVTGQFTVPEDFGEVHNVLLTADSGQVARAGFQERVAASISPSSGPVGTPIDIHVTGLAAKQFSGLTLAVRWDNAHTGLINGTLNHGTADALVRAAGPIGTHEVVLNAGGAPAYLNIAQSPYAFFYQDLPDQEDIKLPFTVTADNGPPANTLDWPDPSRVAQLAPDAPRTATSDLDPTGVSAALDSDEGPILSQPTLTVSGLAAGQPVEVTWMTAKGNRVTASGWSLVPVPLATVAASDQGSLMTPVTIPDDLGGWHEVQVTQNGQVVAQTPYLVDRSLASVSPTAAHAGDTVMVHLKGFGWTELDNGAAVTYDNQSVGYVCGFNSSGDVTLQMTAAGAPGTHLIDLYPMVYQGRDDVKPWYLDPVLSYRSDFPALPLGYRLPAFRLAITITP